MDINKIKETKEFQERIKNEMIEYDSHDYITKSQIGKEMTQNVRAWEAVAVSMKKGLEEAFDEIDEKDIEIDRSHCETTGLRKQLGKSINEIALASHIFKNITKIDVEQRYNRRFQKLHDNAVQYMTLTGLSQTSGNKPQAIMKK